MSAAGTDLASAQRARSRDCGPVRPSRRGRWRATSLILVHVLVAVHIWHWKTTGHTLTPLEPSEAIQTVGKGLVNAGFLFFALLILGTLVLGRFFCGWGCHIVALQDLCTWLLRKVGIRPRPFRSRLLVFVPILAAFWMFVMPFLLRVILGHPAPDWRLHLVTENFWDRFPGWVVGGLTFGVCGFLIVYVLGNKGFCTYGCPYGGIFGLVDRVAPGRIRVTDACEGCGHCTVTCTSNVLVHQEVKHYKMVVDPGCMKCLDCVSVCPKDALYYGFGSPLLAKGEAPIAPLKRRYDYSWREEGLLAAAFVFSMFSLTALYSAVPLLLALGASAISAYVFLCGWRFFRGQDVTFARARLRRAGRWTAAAPVFVVGISLWALFLVHSGAVQYWKLRGTWDLNRSASALHAHPEDAAALSQLRAAADRLARSDRWGFVATAGLNGKLAGAYAALGEHGRAEERYRRAAALARDYPEAHFQLATYAKQRGDTEAVIAELQEVVKSYPSYPGAHQELAAALAATGRLAEAVSMLRDLARRAPGDVEIRLTLAAMLAQTGEITESLEVSEEVLRTHPENASAHLRRGQALAALRRYEEALPEVERAIALDGSLAIAHYTAALIELRLDREDAAEASMHQAVTLEPMVPTFARSWAGLLARLHRIDPAIEEAQGDTSRAARFRLMYLYEAAGRREEAVAISKELGLAGP